ncbi:hypothetical protein VO63_12335 [Streptomyces showdoensis]|uniref:Lipoprotein n=1 Tax=Streptomyces showdoensis TaxID=68268 RepID=A0A2P2GPP4_STREW|nr:hypothetical protein VO63_12335 [Streptomyces showdoensis]
MFKRSTTVSYETGSRAVRAAVLVVSGGLVLGGCSLVGLGGGGSGAPSEPVRVESRDAALTRAGRVQEHVRRLTGLELNPWVLPIAYYRCPGRGTGIADAGEPYRLVSPVQLKVTDDRRPGSLRALLEKLAGEGFEIAPGEFGSADASDESSGDFEAAHDRSDPYTVSVRSETRAGKDGGIIVTVTLPCQAPPPGSAPPAPTAAR